MKKSTILFLANVLGTLVTFHAHATKTTIMTFNVRREGKEKNVLHTWRNRVPVVQEMLTTIKPSIASFQEASPQQIQDIKTIFGPTYAWVGVGRQQEGLVGWFCSVDEHTPIFFNTTRYELLEHDTFWLNPHKTPKKSGWGAWLNRICTWAHLKNKKNGSTLWIFNAHLDHQSKRARSEGLKLIFEEIHQKTKPNELVIVMGDFNAPIDSGDLNPIFQHYGMVDTKQVAKKRTGPPWTAFKRGWQGEGKTIDHIVIKSPTTCSIKHHAVWMHPENKRISDHNPVYITLNC